VEWSPEQVDDLAQKLHLRRPKRYAFTSFETLQEFNDLDALDEGYVLQAEMCPGAYWRLKVKNPAYLVIAHLRENGAISYKRIVQLIFMGEHAEYLSYFPEDYSAFEPWLKAYEKLIADIEKRYQKNKHLVAQKDFALAVKEAPCAAVLFALRKGLTVEETFTRLSDNKKLVMLEGYKN